MKKLIFILLFVGGGLGLLVVNPAFAQTPRYVMKTPSDAFNKYIETTCNNCSVAALRKTGTSFYLDYYLNDGTVKSVLLSTTYKTEVTSTLGSYAVATMERKQDGKYSVSNFKTLTEQKSAELDAYLSWSLHPFEKTIDEERRLALTAGYTPFSNQTKIAARKWLAVAIPAFLRATEKKAPGFHAEILTIVQNYANSAGTGDPEKDTFKLLAELGATINESNISLASTVRLILWAWDIAKRTDLEALRAAYNLPACCDDSVDFVRETVKAYLVDPNRTDQIWTHDWDMCCPDGM